MDEWTEGLCLPVLLYFMGLYKAWLCVFSAGFCEAVYTRAPWVCHSTETLDLSLRSWNELNFLNTELGNSMMNPRAGSMCSSSGAQACSQHSLGSMYFISASPNSVRVNYSLIEHILFLKSKGWSSWSLFFISARVAQHLRIAKQACLPSKCAFHGTMWPSCLEFSAVKEKSSIFSTSQVIKVLTWTMG